MIIAFFTAILFLEPYGMSYLYETHLHTSFASACANSKGSEYIRLYKELGYSGMIVTDHFYRGHTSILRGLPRKEAKKALKTRLDIRASTLQIG